MHLPSKMQCAWTAKVFSIDSFCCNPQSTIYGSSELHIVGTNIKEGNKQA